MFKKIVSAMKRFAEYMNTALNTAYKADPTTMFTADAAYM